MPGICPICGKSNGRNLKACSRECYAKLRTHHKICVVCGSIFADPLANMTVTCSKECSKQHRRDLYNEGKNDASLQKAHEMLGDSPLTGRFETHMHAKEWVIQSPSGDTYKCRNLKNWLREHEDMLDGTVNQAWDGISKIKYSMQGKRKNPSYQWKGWRLNEWGE
jgi:predicted nucleic acid-binding Zn ribbon protein